MAADPILNAYSLSASRNADIIAALALAYHAPAITPAVRRHLREAERKSRELHGAIAAALAHAEGAPVGPVEPEPDADPHFLSQIGAL